MSGIRVWWMRLFQSLLLLLFFISRSHWHQTKKNTFPCISALWWIGVSVFVIFSCVYFSFHFHSEFDSSKKKKYKRFFFLWPEKFESSFFSIQYVTITITITTAAVTTSTTINSDDQFNRFNFDYRIFTTEKKIPIQSNQTK